MSAQRLLRFGVVRHGERVAAEGPARFYLPDQRALTWALRRWDPARDDRAATAWLTVPPTRSATSGRVDLGDAFLVGRPIVVALDLVGMSS